MAHLARVVVPRAPHHVTQRGNGGARTFFGEEDYALYRDLLSEHCRNADVEVWAWCLMPNHVHLVLVPSDTDGLRRALAPVHRRYVGIIHARRRRTGHFWQALSVRSPWTMSTSRLQSATCRSIRCARVSFPARRTGDGRVRAHLTGKDDGITERGPIRERFRRFADMLADEPDVEAFACLRASESIGRPLGDDRFMARIERATRRRLKPRKRGPKPRAEADRNDDSN